MLKRVLFNAVAVGLATWLLHGITLRAADTVNAAISLLAVGAIFGVLNAFVKPVLTFFSGCLLVLTLGLFVLVINAAMLMLTSWVAGQIGLGWSVADWPTAFLGAVIISIVSMVTARFVKDDKRGR